MAFREELEQLINRYSKENGSNTPDFIITDYLVQCLQALDVAISSRDKWRDLGNVKFAITVGAPAEVTTS